MHTELNHIIVHLWIQSHCLELIVNIGIIPVVNYTGEFPALSLLLISQVGYLGFLKNNMAFTGFSTQGAKSSSKFLC